MAELLDEMGRTNEALDAAREAERFCDDGEGRERARALVERLAPRPTEPPPANVVPMRVVAAPPDDNDNDDDALTVPESERATFADVGGLDDIKEQIRMKIVLPFQRPEIFKAYGNHPSFAMFTLGNELGRRPAMFQMVAYFKEIDPRRLYAQGSNNRHWEPSFAEGDDFWVTGKTAKTLPVRGSFSSLPLASARGRLPRGRHRARFCRLEFARWRDVLL